MIISKLSILILDLHFINDHFLGELKMYIFNYLSSIFFYLLLPLLKLNNVSPLTPSHWDICVLSLYIFKLFQSCFLHLVHHFITLIFTCVSSFSICQQIHLSTFISSTFILCVNFLAVKWVNMWHCTYESYFFPLTYSIYYSIFCSVYGQKKIFSIRR